MVTWEWVGKDLMGTGNKGVARITRCSWVSHGRPAAYNLELYIGRTFWKDAPYTLEEAKDFAEQKIGG